MSVPLIIVLVIVIALVAAVILIYNGLVQRRLRIDEAYAQIQVQLKRRWDLIPNLVNAVKGYMGFEQAVLTQVTEARATAVSAGAQGPAASAAAENALTQSLRSLFAVVENYPQLRANENVMNLQEQLTTTENQISFSRQHYNATVLDYNTTIQTLPSMLIAGPLGFIKREFFEAEEEAQARPTVDLGTYGAGQAAAAPTVDVTPPTAAPPPAPAAPSAPSSEPPANPSEPPAGPGA